MTDKVYIILVNYKKYQDTVECLESIFKSSYKNFQVLIVDNSPDHDSSVNIQKWLNNSYKQIETLHNDLVYPLINEPVAYKYLDGFAITAEAYTEPVLLIKAKNDGFSAANNIALKYISKIAEESSYVWILNNDTVIDKLAIEKLVEFYKARPDDAHFITSKLLLYGKKDEIQAITGNYNKWTGSSYHIGEGEKDRGQYDNYCMTDTNYLVGASMFMPKKLITQVGLMSEDYFLYFEDLDWSRQAVKCGFKLALQPAAIVFHKEGGTNVLVTGNKINKDIGGYYTLINRLKFTKRWYPQCLFTVLLGVVYGLTKRIFQGKWKFVRRACFAIFHLNKIVRYQP